MGPFLLKSITAAGALGLLASVSHAAPLDAQAVPVWGAPNQVTPQTAPAVTAGTDVADPAARQALQRALVPANVPTGVTFGAAAGLGIQPAVPDMAALDHQAAQAVIAAFQTPDTRTAEQAASNAAATVVTPVAEDPALTERIVLARTVFRVDGTEELIDHFVATTHMRLIIGEVARHIDIAKLSEVDKNRLAALAAMAQTELEDKILNLGARTQAQVLSKDELMQLMLGYNIDAERKLTDLRLHDDGRLDKTTELDVTMAQYQIVKSFEAGQ